MTADRKFAGLVLALAAGAFALAPTAAALAQPYQTPYDANQAQYQSDQARQDQVRRDYDAQYGQGSYDRYYGAQVDANREARHECHQEKQGNAVAGGLIGGIAGR